MVVMRLTTSLFSIAFFVAACGDNIHPPGDGATADGPTPGIDTAIGTPDADVDADPTAPDAAADAAIADASPVDANPAALWPHLVITEVDVDGADEFIEIYNPTGASVNLRPYYLSDANNYWRMPEDAANPIALDGSDFIRRFPMGASIDDGQVVVIAIDGAAFEASYGTVPDYAIGTVGNSTAMDIPIPPTTGTIDPNLANAGEMVALYRWIGPADLVFDADLVLAGNALAAAHAPVERDGVSIDGPDSNSTPTAYQDDAVTIEDMQSDTSDVTNVLKTTYKRVAFETGSEVDTGGNGIGGHDETSEQLRTTWDSAALPTGYTAATPGTVPASLQ